MKGGYLVCCKIKRVIQFVICHDINRLFKPISFFLFLLLFSEVFGCYCTFLIVDILSSVTFFTFKKNIFIEGL